MPPLGHEGTSQGKAIEGAAGGGVLSIDNIIILGGIVPGGIQMRSPTNKGFFILAAVSMLAACASNSPTTPAITASAPPSTPAATTPARAITPAAAPSAKQKTNGPSSGYRRVVKGKEEYFCRREAMTGSRTQVVETCLTQAQMTAQLEASQELMRQTRQNPGEQPQPMVPEAMGPMDPASFP
jgi:hypothetical protein